MSYSQEMTLAQAETIARLSHEQVVPDEFADAIAAVVDDGLVIDRLAATTLIETLIQAPRRRDVPRSGLLTPDELGEAIARARAEKLAELGHEPEQAPVAA